MTQKNDYIRNLFIGSLAGGLMGAFIVLSYGAKNGKAQRKDIRNKTGESYNGTKNIITDAKIKVSEMMSKGKKIIKEVEYKFDSIVSNVKDDNALQINIMGSAGIPRDEMHKYALSSVADGKVLREYINEIKSGEITSEEAIKRVKNDYKKMKSGEKEGKFVSPSKSEHN
jgi:gas vesicle protein